MSLPNVPSSSECAQAAIVDHWYTRATRVMSPNCDDRPDGQVVELIVVHGISLPPGQFGGNYIDQLFTNTLDASQHPYFQQIAALTVSSHVLVRRDGSITQYVPFNRRAWHAGASFYEGRERCNDFSIGIELEGTDDQPYEAAQYQALAILIQALWRAYPSIKPEALLGHEHVAPGRKTDPGPWFDWQLLARTLKLPKTSGERPWN